MYGKWCSTVPFQVTETFDTIFLMDVPKMGLESKDMARRFITFIDGMVLHL